MERMEPTALDESRLEVERQSGMVSVRSRFSDCNPAAEEEGAIMLRLETLLGGPRVDSSPSSFSYFSGISAPDDQRSAPSKSLGGSAKSLDSEQSTRTRDDELCFERIMWSTKDISEDFLTACSDELDTNDLCQLSESWFQKDARHYDEQQTRQRRTWPLLQLDCAKISNHPTGSSAGSPKSG